MTTPTTITTTKTRVIEIESVMIIEFFSSQRREDFERLYHSYAIRYILHYYITNKTMIRDIKIFTI